MNEHTDVEEARYLHHAEFDGEHWVDRAHRLLSLGLTTAMFVRATRGFIRESRSS
jgi:hypothetical protein